MNGIMVDSNVILDIFLEDPQWVDWSELTLNQYGAAQELCINPIVYAEVSMGFNRIEELEQGIATAGFRLLPLPNTTTRLREHQY